jgi:hypothetical protein
MDYTPIVLKNKGVPAEFAKTKKNDDGTWSRVFGADGEPETHVLHIRVTNNTVAEMEETWGSLDGWQDAMDKQPILTLRKTLSLALRRDPYEIGESMLEGQQVTYQNCVAVAWAIANGVDPTAASLALRQSAGLAEEQRRVVEQALLQNPLSAQDSPGKSGSTSGRKRAARSKSSGN